jgi:hypothetical protein
LIFFCLNLFIAFDRARASHNPDKNDRCRFHRRRVHLPAAEIRASQPTIRSGNADKQRGNGRDNESICRTVARRRNPENNQLQHYGHGEIDEFITTWNEE